MLKTIAHPAFGLYAWTSFFVHAVITSLLLAITPGQSNRRRIARAFARSFLVSAGLRLQVDQDAAMPAEACVVVANHASYLDGIVLTAALPPNFAFVIKQEIRKVPIGHFLLRRLGSHFVDRFDRRQGARDARRLINAANDGSALAFFPEGTFETEPGLLPFRRTAFTAAARASLPLVPVVITGTRRALPAGSPWVRPGGIHVRVMAPLEFSASRDAPDARMLLQMTRRTMLRELDEPDRAAGPWAADDPGDRLGGQNSSDPQRRPDPG
jgi:1-acyl-sn-glycerol-3-phosphate acyltransferase